MKINRLELLKANIGIELAAGHSRIQRLFYTVLHKRAMEEYDRQAGILGASVKNSEKAASALVGASFNNATYSDRIWMYQGMMKAEL